MPFLQAFGLRDYPFRLTPDPDCYFPVPQTDDVLRALLFSIERGDGVLKIVGPVGTGKTLLCRLLLDHLTRQRFHVAYISAPIGLHHVNLFALIAAEFGMSARAAKMDPAVALQRFLLDRHAKGERCLLIIDEAQALGAEGLEAVRLLSNIETQTDKLLQIVLFGQDELDEILLRDNMRQFLQRVQFSFYTKPIRPDHVGPYIEHRLLAFEKQKGKGRKNKNDALVKREQLVRFAPDAVRLVARASCGVPRIINVLADKAMLAAYAAESACVKIEHVKAACQETQSLRRTSLWRRIMRALRYGPFT